MALRIRSVLYLLIIVSVVFQLIAFPTLENVASVLICGVAIVIVVSYVVRRDRFDRFPLSSVTVLGFCVTTSFVSLCAQSFFGQPLTYNLRVPIDTFSMIAGFQITLVVVHALYAMSSGATFIRERVLGPVLGKIGVFSSLTSTELWLFGIVGCVGTWFGGVDQWTDIEAPTLFVSTMRGLQPFLVAPFLIPVLPLLSGRPARQFSQLGSLALYFCAVLILAMARNSRGVFADTMLLVALLVFIGLVSRRVTMTRPFAIGAVVACLVAVPLIGALSDLSTAMLVARHHRTEVGFTELIASTIEAYSKKDVLAYNLDTVASLAGSEYYNEVYIPSAFLNRLSQTKYIENTLWASQRMPSGGLDAARAMFLSKSLSILPTPLINALGGQGFDKFDYKFSTGDYYQYLVLGYPTGGYKTGSSLADGMYMFGWLYVPLFSLFAVISFLLYDSLSPMSRTGIASISFYAAIQVRSLFFNGAVAEGVAIQIDFLTRSFVQPLVIFAILLVVIRLILSPFINSNSKLATS